MNLPNRVWIPKHEKVACPLFTNKHTNLADAKAFSAFRGEEESGERIPEREDREAIHIHSIDF